MLGVAPQDSGTSDWYRRAAVELAGTSDLQVAWAAGIAADETVVALIDRLPREHRQPSLVFSVARWLGAPAAEWPEFREFLVEEWPRIEAAARERRTQTNEVGRCAPLLAALDRIAGPIALLEVGASAGLCLGVDAYAYRFDDEPVVGDGAPLLECRTSGAGRAPTVCPTSSGGVASISPRCRSIPLRIGRGAISPGWRPCSRPTARSGWPGSAPHAPPSRTTRPRSWPAMLSARCPRSRRPRHPVPHS